MRTFAGSASFDPATAELSLTIAANDFQRDLLLPDFFRRIEASVRALRLRVIPSQSPSPAMLRENRCDLMITPLPPSGVICKKLLLQDHYVCYYDASVRRPPTTRAGYLAARHITVVYTDNERLDFDRRLAARGIRRDIAVAVPSFNGVPALLKDSSMLASMPGGLASHLMRDFASVRIPLTEKARDRGAADVHGLAPPFQKDPAHMWLREQLETTVAGVGALGGAESSARATGQEKARARRAVRVVAFGPLPLTPP